MLIRARPFAMALLVLGLGLARPAAGQVELGDLVSLKNVEVVLRIGPKVVGTGDVHRVFRVAKVNGMWLWLEAADLAGWVKSDQVLLLDAAIQDATARIEGGDQSPDAYNARGLLWADQGRPDLAEADYGQAIRLDPGFGLAYLNRGLLRQATGNPEAALADLNEAARRAQLNPLVYYNRGLVLAALGRFEEAIQDFGAAIELEPRHSSAWFNRAALLLVTGKPLPAATDAKVFLKLVGWNEDLSPYAALVAWAGATRGGKPDQARQILEEAFAKGKARKWPAPILGHLTGQMDLETLLGLAASEDEKAEARAYAAVALEAAGRKEAAAEQFRWVARNADPARLPHAIARTALGEGKPPGEVPPGP
jgi:tetratricopeptide (TPR) repeat protein